MFSICSLKWVHMFCFKNQNLPNVSKCRRQGAAALMDSNMPCNVFRVPSRIFLPKNLLQAHVYSLHIFSSCPKTRSISLNVKVRHFWNKNFKMNSSLGCLGYIRLPDIFQFSIEPKSLPVVTFYHLQDKRSRQETNHFPISPLLFCKR